MTSSSHNKGLMALLALILIISSIGLYLQIKDTPNAPDPTDDHTQTNNPPCITVKGEHLNMPFIRLWRDTSTTPDTLLLHTLIPYSINVGFEKRIVDSTRDAAGNIIALVFKYKQKLVSGAPAGIHQLLDTVPDQLEYEVQVFDNLAGLKGKASVKYDQADEDSPKWEGGQ